MKYKFQYTTQEEKDKIINTNKDKRLFEIQNITEGNFLIFSDEPVYVNVPEEHLSQLQKRLEESENAILTLMDMQII